MEEKHSSQRIVCTPNLKLSTEKFMSSTKKVFHISESRSDT